MIQDRTYTFTNALRAVLVVAVVLLTGGTALAQVQVHGSVYGGGNLADVKGNAEVSMSYGTVEKNVFGGGKGKADNFTCDKAMVGENNKGEDSDYANGNATVTITNGTVKGNVYGGGEVGRVEMNTSVTIGTAGNTSLTPVIEGNVYGAGKGEETHGYSALVRGNSIVTIQGKAEVWQTVHGGGEKASVGRYQVAITQALADQYNVAMGMPCYLKAGGKCTVNIQDGVTIGKETNTGDVYGAGQGVTPSYTYTEASTYDARMDNSKRMVNYVEYNSETNTGHNTNLKGKTWDYYVDEDGNEDTRYVWEYFTTKDAYLQYVETLGRASETDVVIGGKRESTGITLSSNAPTVKGSVYGGSESGFVYYGTEVNIASGAVGGDVFGGGKGLESYAEAGRVRRNTEVKISGGSIGNNVYGGGELGDVGNITKNSSYNYTWSDQDGNDNTSANTNNKNTGVCKVEITGGKVGPDNNTDAKKGNVFGAGKGMDDTYWCEKAMVYSTNVSISKGSVTGSVYGGGELGRVEDNATVTIGTANGTDAITITGSVFGAGAGVETHGYSALVRGNASVTVQGKSSVGGSVYGGGETASVGRFYVNPSTSLPTEPLSGGTCAVTVNGEAVITGNVYGACKGVEPANYETAKHWMNDNEEHGFDNNDKYLEFLTTLALTSNTIVNIGGTATVGSSVYGGGQRGITLGYVEVDMTGGTVSQDVYGGGALANTNTANWNSTTSTLTPTYYEITGLTVGTSVVTGLYTRSGDAEPYTYTEITAANTTAASGTKYYRLTDTQVNLTGGTVTRNVYGGGLGQQEVKSDETVTTEGIPAYVYGEVTVNLNDNSGTCQVNGNVFGCNNENGSPKGNVTVNVYGTYVHNADGTQKAKPTKFADYTEVLDDDNDDQTDDLAHHAFEMTGVYGGGNLATYNPVSGKTTTVNIRGCETTNIKEVYGGGRAAAVPECAVNVYGAHEIGYVFGGGNGTDGAANVGNAAHTFGTGNATTTINGGTIYRVFGGPNKNGDIFGTPTLTIEDDNSTEECDLCLGDVFSYGNEAKMSSQAQVTIVCLPRKIGALYGGAMNADVDDDIVLNIHGGQFHQVFGGNKSSGTIGGSITVNVEQTEDCAITIDELYGCGNEAEYSTPSGKTHPQVNIISCQSIGAVYGGGLGSLAKVTGNPTVNINMVKAEINNEEILGTVGNVYGGGKGADVTGNTTVNIGTASTVTLPSDSSSPDVVGANITGSVYGGGEAANVDGNTEVNIGTANLAQSATGIAIAHDVYGGGEGASTNVTGSVTVNVGDQVTSGNTTSFVGGATISGDVYGGSAFGRVNGQETVSGTTTVNLYKGTITGAVFGGGKGVASTPAVPATDTTPEIPANPGVVAEVHGATTVTLYGDVVAGGIYGGCNLNGTMKSSTQLNLLGGRVGTSGLSTTPDIVFGGGLGPDTKVDGNVTVNIGDADNAGTTIYSNVYGGSAKGTVNSSTNNTTTVNLFKGIVHGDVFGGGLGDADNAAAVKGKVVVNLNENDGTCVVTGSIYGCNNTNGSPEGDVEVHIYNTVHLDGSNVVTTTPTANTYELTAVYGGGKSAEYNASGKTTKVFIETCDPSIAAVYGGGFGADVPNTYVEVIGAHEIGMVFGGGYGEGSDDPDDDDYNPGANVNGTTTVLLEGGIIHEAYGGSNTKGDITGGTNVDVTNSNQDCPLDVGKVYGGGKNARMGGGANVILGCQPEGVIDEVYGGAEAADIDGDVELTITSGHYRNVYGGNKSSGMIRGSIRLNIEESKNCATELIIDHLYGCGNAAPYSVYGYYKEGTVWKPRTAADYNNLTDDQKTAENLPYADPELHVVSFTKIGQVFGGGLGTDAKVYGNPKVYINQRPNYKTENDATAGADKHILGTIGAFTYNDGSTTVNVDGGVYGGGSQADVIGNTSVYIGSQAQVEMHSLPKEAVTVGEETQYQYPKRYVEGANIQCNVYGGGLLANVSGNTEVIVGADKVKSDETYTYPATTFAGTSAVEVAKYKGIIITGDVFGAGQGIATDASKALVEANTKVVMAGGSVKKSVYGGGELSQVGGDTDITVSGGTIGTENLGADTYGNVYGGGKGNKINTVSGSNTTISDLTLVKSGLIKGNTKVNISGGEILHNIYGGGAYGSVGTFNYDANGNITPDTNNSNKACADNTGKAEIYITGGTIGTTGKENGMIFGSSRGDVGAPNSIDDKVAWVYDTHVAIGDTATNATITTATPLIKGSIYGGGENGHNYHSTYVRINGGTIGIHDAEHENVTYYDDKEDDSKVTYQGKDYNYPYRGNVYGGGCGTDKYDTNNDNVGDTYNPLAGIVKGDATINITGGKIIHNVYGAGAMGSVGTLVKDNNNKTTIAANTGRTTIGIGGCTIGISGTGGNGNVYGAARGDTLVIADNLALVQDTYVTIASNADVKGSVYGGGEAGDALSSTSVSMTGGTVAHNVFGGGQGVANSFECSKAMVGIVDTGNGSTSVTITNGTVSGSVYGGGEVGRVEANTVVTIGDASETGTPVISGNVFGGGKGKETHGYSALTRGNSTVTVQGKAAIGQSVFGGGEIATVGRFWVKGMPVPPAPEPPADLPEGMPYQLRSGGTSTVVVQGQAVITGDVFGAGMGKVPDSFDYIKNNNTPNYNINAHMPRRMMTYAPYDDSTKKGYKDTDENITWTYYENDHNFVWEYFDTPDKYKTFLQTLAIVNEPHVTIGGSAQVKSSVYGGSESGFVQDDTQVNIQGSCTIGTNGTTSTDGNVFGGGRGLESFVEAGRVLGNTNVNISGGAVKRNVYGGGELGYVGKLTISADYRSFTWKDSDGNDNGTDDTKNTGVCNVIITNGTIGTGVTMSDEGSYANGNVFGAGKGKDDTFWCEKAIVYSTDVSISGGTVKGNVYGGGEVGRVETNTVVEIGPGSIIGNVFGAGAGVETHGYSALVRGNTTVTVQSSATVGHNLYGGGQIAAVGKYYLVDAAYKAAHPESKLELGMPYSLVDENLGVCTVTVTGNAIIGKSGAGHVFGAGKGKVPAYYLGSVESYANRDDMPYRMMSYNPDRYNDNDNNPIKGLWNYYDDEHKYVLEYFNTREKYHTFLETLALATQTVVSIEGSAQVNGSVYGGSESGFVQHNTSVTIKDNSTIGSGSTAETDGNVFGGGLGLATFDKAGRVSGNATVNINGGTVMRNVYGGGSLGPMGNFSFEVNPNTYSKTYTWTEGGTCNVTVDKLDGSTTTIKGNVFGAGKGSYAKYECEPAMALQSNVIINNGTVEGTVYGGGEVGRVDRNTTVTIGKAGDNTSEPDIQGDVFGAGAGVDTHGYSALVRGNATVTIQGKAKVAKNVYGGGKTASVGRFVVDKETSLPTNPVSGGICTVNILGGASIGYNGGGYVFGACKGIEPGKWDELPGHVTGTSDTPVRFTDEADYLNFLKTLALTSNTEVNIGGSATVNGSVYGGGERGVTLAGVKVNMTGGTVKMDVYGGGALADTNTENWDGTTLTKYHEETRLTRPSYQVKAVVAGESVDGLFIKDGDGYQSASGDAVSGTTYYEKVAGSSLVGYYTKSGDEYTLLTSGTADESTTYYRFTDTKVNLTGGVIEHDAYGGGLGRKASTGVTAVEAMVYGDVKVELNNNNNGGTADGSKPGCAVNRVFGCNNLNGTPKGKVQVYVYATQKKDAEPKILSTKATKNTKTYDVQAVYGGGNLAKYEPVDALLDYSVEANKEKVEAARPEVYIDGCGLTSIKQVYGGGNAAPAPATYVEINRAYEIDEAFGGGNGFDNYSLQEGNTTVWYQNPGANVGYYTYATYTDGQGLGTEADPYKAVEIEKFSGGAVNKPNRLSTTDPAAVALRYGSGIATLIVKGGTVHTSYGGSNSKGNVRAKLASTYSAMFDDCPMAVGTSYGGGKNAYSDADAEMSADCAKGVTEMFGGAKDADFEGDVNMLITNGSSLERVFGGNNTSGAFSGNITITIKEGGCEPIRIGSLYAGGYLAPYSVYGYEKNDDGSYKTEPAKNQDGTYILDEEGHQILEPIPLTAAPANYVRKQDPRINVISATRIDNIFGGGFKAKLVGNPHINVNMEPGRILASYSPTEGEHTDFSNHTYVVQSIEEGTGDGILPIGSIGNIYGGGNMADIVGNTYVEIGTGTWVTSWDAEGKAVYENISPARNAATITESVYGGGNQADVTGNTYVTIANGSVESKVFGGGNLGAVGTYTTEADGTPNAWTTGTGFCNVTITGGMVGIENPTLEKPGHVFGGGQGQAIKPTTADPVPGAFKCAKGMVYETNVSISNGTVKGSVYGGGEVGRVENDTKVTIGLEGDTNSTPVVEGEVFGAGKGVHSHGYAALVRGNTYVTVQGNAKVKECVYGGGEIASVGRYNIADDAYHESHPKIDVGMPYSLANNGSGYCNVIVRDNAEVGPDNMQMTKEGGPDDTGYVFGAGKGILPYEGTNDTDNKPGRVKPDNKWQDYSGTTPKDTTDYLRFIETQGLATQTDVTITGNAFIKGSVYGGSFNGHVQHDTHVTIAGDCQIGAGEGMDAPYTKTQWENENPSDFKECAHWGYDASSGAPYDMYATKLIDGKYYYDKKDAQGNYIYAEGGAPVAKDGHTFYGNVFGGGSGYIPYAPGKWHREAGSVGGDTYVNITGGHILTSVYGGNEQTDVGTYQDMNNTTPESGGKCTINMTGGTIGVPRTVEDMIAHPLTCYLFGAGKGDQRIFFNTWTNVVETEVNISGDARIYGSVFGGGEDGHVLGDANVNIGGDAIIGTTGTSYVDGNVFGGGRGFSGEAQTAGTLGGNVTMTISGGTMLGSVYGGGRLASVGTQFTAPGDPNYGNFVEDNEAVYYTQEECDAYNDEHDLSSGDEGFLTTSVVKVPAGRHGHVTINISGGTIGNDLETKEEDVVKDKIYSFALETSGQTVAQIDEAKKTALQALKVADKIPVTEFELYDSVLVGNSTTQYTYYYRASHTKGGNVFGGSMGRLELLDGSRNPIWPKMAQVKTSEITISGDNTLIKRSVYGGGELGTVRDNAKVTINNGTIWRDVYGGGYGSEDRQYTIFSVKEPKPGVTNPSGAGDYNTNTYAFTPMQFAGCVGMSTTVDISGGYIWKNVYGGGEMASVGIFDSGVTEVTTLGKDQIEVGRNGSKYIVYNNILKHWDVDNEFALSWPYEFNYLPIYPGTTQVNVTGGRIGLKKGDGDINSDNGDVCGGGKGLAGDYNDYVFCANVGSSEVNVNYTSSTATPENYETDGDCITGAIYGGAENGHVMGDTKLTLTNGLVGHSIYGGGSGKGQFNTRQLKIGRTPGSSNNDDYYKRAIYSITAGKVFGNTEVLMEGGRVIRNVYGGGNMGSVGKGNYAGGPDDYSAAGYGEKLQGDNKLWDGNNKYSQAFLNSGKCKVTITGGTIGYIDESDPSNSMYPWNSTASLPYGNVFGGCRGESAPNISESPRYLYSPEFFVGYANETEVIIEGNDTKILGSVYGGGMDGHVRRDASVTINGGEIGIPYNDTNKDKVQSDNLNNIQWLARGNVYGAGSGIGKYKYDFNYDGQYTSTVDYDNGRSVVPTKEEDFSTSAGSVTRFTTVTINGGTIHRNVYGGGSLASVGAPKIPPTRTDEPFRKDDTEHNEPGKQSLNEVTIKNGAIGDATSFAAGYGGNVFGASRGDATLDNPTSFAKAVWTDVNIKGGTILGDVYGGGEVGSVRQGTEVDLTGGTIDHDVFGGGKGTSTVAADIGGDVLVTLNGTETSGEGGAVTYNDNAVVKGSIFGANNVNGTPKGHVTVHVFKTANSAKDPNVLAANRTTYDVAAVYGGGKQADYVPDAADTKQSTEVIIEGCDLTSIKEVYGGGYGAATPGTNVLIKGTYIIDNVFGGGYGYSATQNHTDPEAADYNPGANVGYLTDKTEYASGEGKAVVQLMAGTVNHVYGGSNSLGDIRGGSNVTSVSRDDTDVSPNCCKDLNVQEIYGGGKNADMYGGAEIVLSCMPDDWIGAIYAGAESSDVGNDVSLTLTSGKFGRVFGGNKSGGSISGSIEVNIEENPGCDTPIIIGELYGGGNAAPYSVPARYTQDDPDYKSPRVNVRAFTSIGNIYGGGYGSAATVTGNPMVNINEVLLTNSKAYDPATDPKTKPDLIDGVNVKLYPHEAGKMGVINNVFGGGNAAPVIGSTYVNIGTESETPFVSLPMIPVVDANNNPVYETDQNGDPVYEVVNGQRVQETDSEGHPVFENDGTTPKWKRVQKKTPQTKPVVGADIRGNVYGGGNAAKVTGETNVVIGKKTTTTTTQTTP